jgi:hypothetical protein
MASDETESKTEDAMIEAIVGSLPTVSLKEARYSLGALSLEIEFRDRVTVVTRHGKAAFAMVPLAYLVRGAA